MKQNKILSLVGLATKAGKTASGEFSTEKSVKEGKAEPVKRKRSIIHWEKAAS